MEEPEENKDGIGSDDFCLMAISVDPIADGVGGAPLADAAAP